MPHHIRLKEAFEQLIMCVITLKQQNTGLYSAIHQVTERKKLLVRSYMAKCKSHYKLIGVTLAAQAQQFVCTCSPVVANLTYPFLSLGNEDPSLRYWTWWL